VRCPVIELSCKSACTALRQTCTTSIAGPAHGCAHANPSARSCAWLSSATGSHGSTDEAEAFRQFLGKEKIAEQDRVIRRIALRGCASEGVAVSRADLVPEVTITADGVYWHPVGAKDADLLGSVSQLL
jgi:hypothetical protein